MSFLADGCVGHGQASTNPSDVCCSGYTKWPYDAKTGIAYDGFMCWSANCAAEGQYSFQGAGCCSGLVSIDGKCSQIQQAPDCVTIGHAPSTTQVCCSGLRKDAQGICNTPSGIPSGSGCTMAEGESIICGIQDMWIYGGVAALVLLMAMGGKK